MEAADTVDDLVKEFKGISAQVQNFYQKAAGPMLKGSGKEAKAHGRHLKEMFEVEQQLRVRGYELIATHLRTEHDLKTVRSMEGHPVMVRATWLKEMRDEVMWRVDAIMGGPSSGDR